MFKGESRSVRSERDDSSIFSDVRAAFQDALPKHILATEAVVKPSGQLYHAPIRHGHGAATLTTNPAPIAQVPVISLSAVTFLIRSAR